MKQLETQYNTPEATRQEKEIIKKQLQEIELNHNRSIYIRSRIQEINFDEKHTTLFFHSLREKETRHRITTINTPTKKITEPEEIIREVANFYTTLYKKEPDNLHEINTVLSSLDKQVTQEQNNKLISFVTVKEVQETLFQMNKNKS